MNLEISPRPLLVLLLVVVIYLITRPKDKPASTPQPAPRPQPERPNGRAAMPDFGTMRTREEMNAEIVGAFNSTFAAGKTARRHEREIVMNQPEKKD